jgi:hypothetical protein
MLVSDLRLDLGVDDDLHLDAPLAPLVGSPRHV